MPNKPWDVQSSLQTKNGNGSIVAVSIVSKDFKVLAKFLGAIDEGKDLAKKAKCLVEEYTQTPQGASEWLLGEKDFSWVDLFKAFTHGCRNAKDEPNLCFAEMAYNEEYGHHEVLLSPALTFQVYLARAFSLAASYSTECDCLIRWELYNGDWIRYLCQIPASSREIIRVLDLRSLDFFLPKVESQEWDSGWNVPALFDQIDSLTSALHSLGRTEEAEALRIDLAERKKAHGLLSESIPPNQQKNEIRLAAERAWTEYIGLTAWEALHSESRNDLVDAFSAEKAVTIGYYRSWRYALQSMLYVVEREINHSLFSILKGSIEPNTSFTPLNSRSSSRQKTFESVIRAHESGKLLTLGELSFVLKFWNDPQMDKCTDLFVRARKALETISGSSQNCIQTIKEAFSDTFGVMIPPWDIVKLRNSCAHPGNEGPLREKTLFAQLKVTMGEPPRKLIQTIVVQLRGISLTPDEKK